MPSEYDRISINRDTRDVTLDGKSVPLTRLEFELLSLLADRVNTVVTKEEIGRTVWGYSDGSSNRAIESHFNRMRRKFGDFNPIVTKWGVGYMFAPDGIGIQPSPADDASAVLVVKPDARVFWASDSVRHLLGWAAIEMRDTGLYDHLHPDDRKRAEARQGILESGETFELQYRVRTKSGEYRDVLARAEPMLDGENRLLGVVNVWTAAG